MSEVCLPDTSFLAWMLHMCLPDSFLLFADAPTNSEPEEKLPEETLAAADAPANSELEEMFPEETLRSLNLYLGDCQYCTICHRVRSSIRAHRSKTKKKGFCTAGSESEGARTVWSV